MAAEDEGLPHLADRLNLLFAHVPPPDSAELYSNERAAEDLTSSGASVTAGYLRQLRSGKRRNPTARLLAAIAKLFDVPITYFFDDEQAAKIQTQLTALSNLKSAGVRGIIGRSNGLTAQDIAALGPVFDRIRQIQQQDQSDE